MIWEDLKKQELEILKTAGLRERLLLHYLTKEDHFLPQVTADNLTVLEKFSYSVFTGKNAYEADSLYDQIKNQKQTKGMHYSTNIVSLSAMALHNFEEQRENIKNYLTECTIKEKILLSILFPKIESEINLKFELTDSSSLIDKVLCKSTEQPSLSEEWVENLYEVLKTADLIDIFVVKKTLLKNFLSPLNKVPEHDIITFKENQNKLISFLDNLLMVLFTVIIFAVLSTPFKAFVNTLINNWQQLEPYTYLISLALSILAIVLAVVFGRSDWKIITQVREPVLNKLYKLFKLNRVKFKDLIK